MATQYDYKQDWRVLRAMSSLADTGHLALVDEGVGDVEIVRAADEYFIRLADAVEQPLTIVDANLRRVQEAVADWYRIFDLAR